MTWFVSDKGLSIFVFGAIGWGAAFAGGIFFHRFPLSGKNQGREKIFIGGFMAVLLVIVAVPVL